MPSIDDELATSYAACRAIMRAHASTFSLACRLLPPERRRATIALYGVFRTLDDLVDESDAVVQRQSLVHLPVVLNVEVRIAHRGVVLDEPRTL